MHANLWRSRNVVRFFFDCTLQCIFHSFTSTTRRHQSNSAVSIIQQIESRYFHHLWSCQRNMAEHAFKVLIKPRKRGRHSSYGRRRKWAPLDFTSVCFYKALHQCILNSDECHLKQAGEQITFIRNDRLGRQAVTSSEREHRLWKHLRSLSVFVGKHFFII